VSIVTDQALLEKLNNTSQSGAVKVEDPKILEQLALMEKAQNPPPVEIPEPSDGDSFLDTLVGVGETALTMGSGVAADVASGLSGLTELALSGGDTQSAVNVMDKVREAVT